MSWRTNLHWRTANLLHYAFLQLLYQSCVLSACFAIAIRVTRFVHMHTCYLSISCGSYSRAATISFSMSGGAATI